jgi:hypothetical protein
VTVTAALSLTLPNGTGSVPPRGTLDLTAMGGTAPLSYAVSSNNSGASVNAATGAYVAGAKGSVVDTVTVTDANSQTASVTITVGPPLTITASTNQPVAGTPVTLTAMGGSGMGLTWSLATVASGTGSTGDPGTLVTNGNVATYTPGTNLQSAVISVQDSLGNQGMLNLAIVSTTGVGKGAGSALGGGGCTMAGEGRASLPVDLVVAALVLIVLVGRARSCRRGEG